MNTGKKWTEEEDAYLKAHTDLPDEILARKFKRTPRAVYDRRKTLHLPPKTGYRVGVRKPEVRSDAEKSYRILKLAKELRVKLLKEENK